MKNKLIWTVALCALLATMAFRFSPSAADDLLGVWQTGSGKAKVKVEKIGSKYYGKIVWLKEPNDPVTNKPKVDKNNPDEKLRNTPLKGYRILKDFVFKNNEWTDGTIYDPENGSTYKCVIKKKDASTIEIRGYIGVQAFGRTDTWKKMKS